jgi:integrase
MPIYLDKKTNRYYIEFQYKKHRHKERLPAGATKRTAERLEVKLKNDLMFQSHGITGDQTFETFIAEIIGPMAENWPKARWDRMYLLVRDLMPFVKGKPLRSIKATDLERFKQSRANLLTMHGTIRKPATIEREMSIISSLFTIAVDDDLIEYNPCTRVKRIKFNNEVDKILRREHEDIFFANMHSEWARDICRMALYSGLRQNDIMKLTRFQVDLDEETIALVQGKTVARVLIPMHPIVKEIIQRRMCNGLLFASPVTGTEHGSVRHAMQRACKRAKIPVITIRDLRRTCATRQIEEGNDFTIVAKNMGHGGTRMMPRYTKSLDAQRRSVHSLVRKVK